MIGLFLGIVFLYLTYRLGRSRGRWVGRREAYGEMMRNGTDIRLGPSMNYHSNTDELIKSYTDLPDLSEYDGKHRG